LSVTVTDNGTGFPGLSGSYQDDELRARDAGPISLLSRVADLGGTLKLDTSPEGSRIEIDLPL
jgi:signal transduction histidine kinase